MTGCAPDDIDDPARRPVVCSFAGTLTVIPRPALNMTVPLGSPQPVFALPPLDAIPDVEEDKPVDGLALVRHDQLRVQITVIDMGIERDRPYGLARDRLWRCNVLEHLQLRLNHCKRHTGSYDPARSSVSDRCYNSQSRA